ncbi:MFS transporter [Agrococcus sp. Marseille-P2731]|uniref:MFS transporter n=1 Tax=Agrococcus sp. Marseille-P2731 TaxID=1841862 RepID=UPI000931ACC7|nr:MFS transporter [Agrococcus sp. Marseille-P2731]
MLKSIRRRRPRGAEAVGTTRIPRSVLIAFTLPTIVLGIMHGPEGVIQGVYAKHAGLALGGLAIALLVTKMFDAITYPLIGSLSDRTYARTGSRRGWIIGGTIISVVGMWALLHPPAEPTVVYFGVSMSVLYLGWKTVEIPLQAWSYNLSADHAQRARVQGWRGMGQVVGQLLFFFVPALAFGLGVSDSTEIDFRSLGVLAVIALVAMPVAAAVMLLVVPSGAVTTAESVSATLRSRARETLRALRGNPPLMRLLAAFLPVNLLAGMSGGLAYLYMDVYLGLSAELPAVLATSLVTSIIGIPIWTALSARFERHRVWAVALILGAIACASFVLVQPGPGAFLGCILLFPIVTLVLSGSVVVYTMSADVVDYGRLHTGRDHGGLYGSMFAFLQKSLLGVAGALGLGLVGAFGFDAEGGVQTTAAVVGITFGFSIAPALGLLAAAAIIWRYPLDRAAMAEVQAGLEAVEAVEASGAGATAAIPKVTGGTRDA